MLPRNAAAIVDARAQGLKPAESVVVSFVGETDFAGPHVYADSGKVYDWRFLHGLHAAIVVKPGIDAADAMRSIFAESDLTIGYPTLIDIEQQHVAFVIDNKPLRLWPRNKHGADWKAVFECS